MHSSTEKNKAIVIRFNKEVLEQGNRDSFLELVNDNVINHAAAPGTPAGRESMEHFLLEILRPAFPDLEVKILAQIAEDDLVTTRKSLHATHSGTFFGIPPTHKKVMIDVIDIIRLKDGKYAEHWGISNIPSVLAQLSEG